HLSHDAPALPRSPGHTFSLPTIFSVQMISVNAGHRGLTRVRRLASYVEENSLRLGEGSDPFTEGADEVQRQFPAVRAVAVLDQIDGLPGAQLRPAVRYRHSEARRGE